MHRTVVGVVQKMFLFLTALLWALISACSPSAGPAAAPTAAPTPGPGATSWLQGEKPPWPLAVALAALSFILGLLFRPTFTRWGQVIDRWLQGLGFRFERAYLSALAERHRYLKLVGVRGRTAIGRPRLRKVYVPLQMVLPGRESETGSPRELSVSEALRAHQRLVVLGEPGAGKSTLLRYILLAFCGDIPQSDLGVAEKRFPIYVRLKDCITNDEPISEIITKPPTLPVSKCPPGFLEARLKRGQCIVLLDGLDEVVNEDQKKAVADKVAQMVGDYNSGNRYVVTCRTAGWNPNLLPGSFVALKIRDFNPAQVARFIHDWYKAVLTAERLSIAGESEEKRQQARQEAADEAQKQADDLVSALEAHEGLARLSKNPLILSLIALSHYHRRKLPQRRAEIYQDCLDVLLDQWDRDEHGIVLPDAPTLQAKLAIVQKIAWDFQTTGQDEANVDELCARIAPILQAWKCKVGPKECIKKQIAERSGLLVDRAIDCYGFAHRTLQEYLVAKAIVAEPEKRDELLGHLVDESWREVLLLYVGLAGTDVATSIVRGILAWPDDPTHALLLLAGQCLAEDIRVEESVRKKCLARLEAAFHSTPDLLLFARLGSVLATIGGEDIMQFFERALNAENLQVRLVAAESLGNLGKWVAPPRIAAALLSVCKRNEVMLRRVAIASLGQLGHDSREVVTALEATRREDPDPAVRATAVGSLLRLGRASELGLVRVPAGEFLMGSEEYDDERPPHRIYVDEYYISRYPVTNADFDRFVQARGYSQKQWWTKAGWRWKGDHSGPERYGGVFDRPNHPVVGVSWYEAVAYAAWAGMRLPTEAEWEKAARGTDGRQWPWGNTFETSRCNTGETRKGPRGFLPRLTTLLRFHPAIIGGTTPVGRYSPAGDSPYGCADMAGNVWEWCVTKWLDNYKNYEQRADQDPEGDAARVVRGGSWDYDLGDARCAGRLRLNPDFRYWDLGFRVVAVGGGLGSLTSGSSGL